MLRRLFLACVIATMLPAPPAAAGWQAGFAAVKITRMRTPSWDYSPYTIKLARELDLISRNWPRALEARRRRPGDRFGMTLA